MENIKMIIKKRLPSNADDSLIDYYIESAKQRIMNDCWRDDFPEQLSHIVVEMVVGKMSPGALPGVTSVKRGDFSTSFDSSDAFHRTLVRYEDELSLYRKVKVG